jgi:hypothetical protein
MKDQLEEFIHRNREAFDDREPSPTVWNRIDASLRFKRDSWKNAVVWWRAAAIFFMALSAFLLFPKESLRNDTSVAMKEFSDVEAFYVQQISNKVELIHEFQQNEGLNGFTHDFKQLEAMYQVLREEMKTRPSEKVKDALVLNLLVRIDLLNQQLHRLEEKQVETEKQKSERST